MANNGEDANGLRYIFLIKPQDVNFPKVQLWLENLHSEILQKCCLGVDFLHEIAFNHLVRAS